MAVVVTRACDKGDVVLHDAVAQTAALAQYDACTCLVGDKSVLEHEAVDHGRCGEVVELVEYTVGMLSVEDGGVGLEVALAKVVGGCLIAHKATIYVHFLMEQECPGCGGVAIVGALGYPDARIAA